MRPDRDALDALVNAAREGEGPTAADRARIRAAVMARVAPPPPPPSAPPRPPLARTLAGPAVGGVTAVVVAVGVALLAPRRAPPPRRAPAVATASIAPPAPRPPPPLPRAARTEDAPPRPIAMPSTVARRRPRAVLAETEATAAPAPPPVTPTLASRPAVEEPSPAPAPAPAPSLAPASVAGRAPPADAHVGLPPDLVVLAEARALLRAGDARGALARLERFAAEYPDAPRAVERTGARLIARCAEGIAGAREVSEYLSHHGDSPLATGVRDRCATLIPPSR